ncbi:S-protein homolog 1-like [Cucurbita pepo subsp. pepo]|uniref:S-protein homolog 1-like n=1 Tax=Cucurbita pepo subsp. pepo TaxID=3664 RepID=UPI000C9D86ED|nr:S-protein homolog 1-like [Cucurbita pepo subsp. pepo]
MEGQGLMRRLPLLLLLLLLLHLVSLTMSVASKKKAETGPEQPDPNQPAIALRKFDVHIRNGLRMYLLDSHCCSKDDDLGVHVVYPDDEQSWSFRGNWLGSTNFHCKLEWAYGFVEFDAFADDLNFVTTFCGDSSCVWTAKQDGVYLADQNGQLVFKDHWEMLP